MKIEKSVIDQIVALQFSYIGKDPVESMKNPSWRTLNSANQSYKKRWEEEGIKIIMSETIISQEKAEMEMSWIDLIYSINYK